MLGNTGPTGADIAPFCRREQWQSGSQCYSGPDQSHRGEKNNNDNNIKIIVINSNYQKYE